MCVCVCVCVKEIDKTKSYDTSMLLIFFIVL